LKGGGAGIGAFEIGFVMADLRSREIDEEVTVGSDLFSALG